MVRVETITPTLFQVDFKGLWMFYVVFFSTSLHQPLNTSLIDFPPPHTPPPSLRPVRFLTFLCAVCALLKQGYQGLLGKQNLCLVGRILIYKKKLDSY